MMLYIGIFAVIVVACVFISLMMMKKQKETAKKYEGESGIALAPGVKDELLSDEFSELRKQLNGAPIDAFMRVYCNSWRQSCFSCSYSGQDCCLGGCRCKGSL